VRTRFCVQLRSLEINFTAILAKVTSLLHLHPKRNDKQRVNTVVQQVVQQIYNKFTTNQTSGV
jgi:hypothetical protein